MIPPAKRTGEWHPFVWARCSSCGTYRRALGVFVRDRLLLAAGTGMGLACGRHVYRSGTHRLMSEGTGTGNTTGDYHSSGYPKGGGQRGCQGSLTALQVQRAAAAEAAFILGGVTAAEMLLEGEVLGR